MEYDLSLGALRARVDTLGGELVALEDAAGVSYLWDGDPAYWSGRNPNLFPIVGALQNDTIRAGGALCRMKRHGFARRKEFRVVELSSSAVRFQLTEDAETLAQYPFPFSFQVEHRLLPDGFSTTYRVKNTGSAPMPFCVGGHTAIRCPLRPGERFEDYRLVFDHPETVPSLKLAAGGVLSAHGTLDLLRGGDTLALDPDQFRALDTFMFRGLTSQGVRLVHRATGCGVRLDFHEFPMVAFWTAPGPFLCLEPWQGCAAVEGETGEFRDKPHCVVLQPGEETARTYSITLV